MIKLATINDLQLIDQFYLHVIKNTPDIFENVKWEYGEHPSLNSIQLAIENQQLYLYYDNQQLIGSAILTNQEEDYHLLPWKTSYLDCNVMVIHLFAIDPDQTRKGYALSFLKEITKIARKENKQAIRLDVIHTNKIATNLYLKFGFIYQTSKMIDLPGIGLEQFDYYEMELRT